MRRFGDLETQYKIMHKKNNPNFPMHSIDSRVIIYIYIYIYIYRERERERERERAKGSEIETVRGFEAQFEIRLYKMETDFQASLMTRKRKKERKNQQLHWIGASVQKSTLQNEA